jgi:hypothetical protein
LRQLVVAGAQLIQFFGKRQCSHRRTSRIVIDDS